MKTALVHQILAILIAICAISTILWANLIEPKIDKLINFKYDIIQNKLDSKLNRIELKIDDINTRTSRMEGKLEKP